MDNNRFDDIIRQKAEQYHDTGHDVQSLTDFRRRMANLPVKNTGSGLGKTGYLLGALTLFTLINFGIVWYFSEGRYTSLNDEIDQLKTERSQLMNSGDNAVPVQEPGITKVDTVYIYRDLPAAQNNQIFPQYPLPTSKKTAPAAADGSLQSSRDQYFTYLNSDRELSDELKTFLAENNLLFKDDGNHLILVVNRTPLTQVNTHSLYGRYPSNVPGTPKSLSEVATYEPPRAQQKLQKKQMSNQVLWALEKHNHRGIDFQFGIEGKYQKSDYDLGVGEWNGGVGFMTDIIFSPVWRLETGIHLATRAYKISENEIEGLPAAILDDYPGYDPQLGELNTLESEVQLIQVPLNLKHFAPLGHNKRWYISAGITPQWSISQEFDYKYSLQLTVPPETEEFVSFVGSTQEVSGGYYTTTLNLGLGTEVYLDRRLRWQLGLFYQKGLGDAGYEQRRLANSYGIKSSLWFNRP